MYYNIDNCEYPQSELDRLDDNISKHIFSTGGSIVLD